MAQGKRRDEHKERQWRRWIEVWRASGLSVRAFCDRHGLSEPSFYGWRRVLTQRAADRLTFLPVHVAEDDRPAAGGVLELVLSRGRTVRVGPGFDAATLRALLRVLEEGRPC
jgi:transposase